MPIVPIVVRGTRSVLRADSWFPRRGPISVSIGPPIHPLRQHDAPDDDWAAALQLRELVRDYMLQQCAEPDLSEHPALTP